TTGAAGRRARVGRWPARSRRRARAGGAAGLCRHDHGRPAARSRRNGRSYGAEELGLLRPLAKQCAVALEQVKARSMLAAAEVELEATRGRVALLEDVRAHLAKFVPQTVQRLIERAPDAPDLGRQEAEVSVLFVDIVGYTRLTEQLDSR